MRLQRNITEDKTCKYAIVRLDKLRQLEQSSGKDSRNKLGRRDSDDTIAQSGLDDLFVLGLLEYGKPGDDEECFVIKLKDQFAEPALAAYIRSVTNRVQYLYAMGRSEEGDSLKQYASDIEELRTRANVHPKKHYPD